MAHLLEKLMAKSKYVLINLTKNNAFETKRLNDFASFYLNV